MSERKTTAPGASPVDPAEMMATMSRVAEKSQQLVADFMAQQTKDASDPGKAFDMTGYNPLDPGVIGKRFGELAAQMMKDPGRLAETSAKMWQGYGELWMSMLQRGAGQSAAPVIAPERGDRRFKDERWNDNPVFDFIKQSYLLSSRYILDAVRETDGLDPRTAKQVDFYTRQYIDAMAPTNFVGSNPVVIEKTMETGGENLLKGLEHMLGDLAKGRGKLRISMTDVDKFELGENVAVTPGKVVYQTDLMQLIQYTPTTKTVFKRPLLVIPPWINKYYILDLRPANSLVRWAVEQGHTVFVISWANPDAALADKSFADYMHEGPLAALDAIEQATGEKETNVAGYCLGGTLLSAMLAWMKDKGDKRVRSATFLTTMVDFSEPGELGVFIDDEQLSQAEKEMDEKGVFDGANMAQVFNLLRANDLIWSFVVNNYLLGKEPFPFDLLYWNSDSTRMPRAMHSFYLRQMYQENALCQPGGVTIDGVDIDLRTIDTPIYMLSAREDHIAPWESTYAGTQLYSGDVRFVLGASGHIAGVVNPPDANKYGYWTAKELPQSPAEWLEQTEYHEGSWWTDWAAWMKPHNGRRLKSREPGAGGLAALEDAPGSYVKVRAG